MFIPNVFAMVAQPVGHTIHGEVMFDPSVRTPCAVVRLDYSAQKTSVRADSTASRGAAGERVAQSRMLFPENVRIEVGSKVEIAGLTLRVTTKEPRYAVTGRLDHFECDLEHWYEG